ncbi:MAG TPA: POTRA domain-containing protein, partial [Promineifilum sp.]|nr:POTRA domain-containing protein [Promineifilum sp.]
MVQTSNDLPAETRKKNCALLNERLRDSIKLGLNAKQAHWNVKGVNFIGNRAFSNQQLRDIISTTQAGWFDFLKGTSVYDPDRLSLDRELLRQYYMKNGYADVRITTANAELDRDGSGFYITFAIDEGVPYNFGPVTLESSLAGVDTGKVRGDVLTVQGEVYNGAYI